MINQNDDDGVMVGRLENRECDNTIVSSHDSSNISDGELHIVMELSLGSGTEVWQFSKSTWSPGVDPSDTGSAGSFQPS